MSYWAGTLLASPIVRGSSGDTYGTHHSVLGVGGYMEVSTIAERNAIPVDGVNLIGFDGITSGQRRMGMLVYVYEEDTIYQLHIDPITWDGLTPIGKVSALGNNTNWRVFSAGDDASSGERLTKQFTQQTHGFDVGDVIGYDGVEYVKVNNISASTIEPLGLVSSVIDIDNFELTISGYINTAGIVDVNSSGLTDGTVYYLSDVDGKLTDVKPSGTTNINKPTLIELSGETGIVLQYRGIYDNVGTLSYDLFSGYTASTQQFLDTVVTGATNLGEFSGFTGIQTLPLTDLTVTTNNGDYLSLYNYYYRDVDGYIRVGAASDGISRRGYLRSTLPAKSWVWNEHTGDGASVGWIVVNADISSADVYGTVLTGASNVGYANPQYTVSEWVDGQSYNNGSDFIISTILGSLTTGDTYTSSGSIYRDKQDANLRLRTIVSETPDNLSVNIDDYYIKLSAATSITNIANVGDGIGVFSGNSGTTAIMKTIIGDGDTSVTENGGVITISSIGGGGSTGVSGENVTKRVTQIGHGFSTGEVVGWSGGTYNKPIADGSYDGEIVGIVSTVVNGNTFDVTQSGYISGQTGLVPNSTYFLSGTYFGGITTTPPSTTGYLVKSVMVATTSTTGWVLPYPGYVVADPITGDTGGSQLYTGKTPSNVTVGALPAGSTLTGRTITSILEEMLITVINPTIIAPSNSFSKLSPPANLYEYGCVIDIDLNSSFSRGSISLSGSFQDYRSGLPNAYYYDGPGLPTTVPSTTLTDAQTVSNYTVSASTQVWNSCVGYDAGPQPYDSDNNPYGTPLPAGVTSPKSVSVSGLYPYYWGTAPSGGVPAGQNRPTVTNDLITGGTKELSSSDGTLQITFGSASDDYLWFAIPETSTPKQGWFVSTVVKGNVGGIVSPGGNLFPEPEIFSACSGQGCWNGVNYRVYVSNYQSGINQLMCITNTPQQ